MNPNQKSGSKPQKPSEQSILWKICTKAFEDFQQLTKLKQTQQLIQQTFIAEAKFTQNGPDAQQRKKQYYNKQKKLIIYVFVLSYEEQINFSQFDQFSMQFYNWLTEEPVPQFPFPTEKVKQLAQKKKKKIQRQMLKQKQEQLQRQKQKERQRQQQMQRQLKKQREEIQRQRIENQKKAQIQLKMQRQQKQRQQQQQKKARQIREREKMQRMNEANNQKQMRPEKMVDESEQVRVYKPNVQKYQNYMQANQNKPSAQLNIQNVPKVQNKSPAHTAQRPDTEIQNRLIYSKPQPTKQQQIKKILAKICESCQQYQKRNKSYQQIKVQLDILKRIQEVQKNRR